MAPETPETNVEEGPAEAPAPEPLAWNPLYDKVIVQRLPEATEIRGFAVPEKHRKAQTIGVVLKVGNGRWIDGVLYPLTIAEGHHVLFSNYAGSPIEGYPDLLVLREDEILAWKEV